MATQKNLGAFMEELASKASPATAATIQSIQDKLQAEKQAELEDQIRRIYGQIESKVGSIRSLNASIANHKKAIDGLKSVAQKLVEGKDLTPEETRLF